MKPCSTVDFLDALKARHDLKSDYALAKLLGTSRSVVSRYRTGTDTFGEEMALKVAALLDTPAGYILSCIAEERTKCPQVKAAWRKVAEALAPTASGTAACQKHSVYYVKPRPSIRPRARSSLLGALTRFSPSPTPAGTAFA